MVVHLYMESQRTVSDVEAIWMRANDSFLFVLKIKKSKNY